METVAKDSIDHRKAVVVAVSFWVGRGFQNQAIFADLLTGTWNALLSNSVTSGGLAAALMIGFIELTAARRKHLEVDLDFTSMPEVDRFLQRFAIDRGWNDASIERLRAVGEETLAIMVLYEDEDTLERRLIINAHVNDDIAELEFLSAAYDVENLEDRLAYMSEQPRCWTSLRFRTGCCATTPLQFAIRSSTTWMSSPSMSKARAKPSLPLSTSAESHGIASTRIKNNQRSVRRVITPKTDR